MQEKPDLDELIAYWEAQEKKASEVLPHLRAARAALRAGRKAPAKRRDAKTGNSKPGNAFKPKYDRPSHVLIARMLENLGPDHKGLTAAGIREALARKGHAFSQQAVVFSLKKLVKRSRIRKVRAPKGVRGTWVYKSNPAHSLSEEELRKELGAAN